MPKASTAALSNEGPALAAAVPERGKAVLPRSGFSLDRGKAALPRSAGASNRGRAAFPRYDASRI